MTPPSSLAIVTIRAPTRATWPWGRSAGIETCVDEVDGGHTFVTFRRLLARAFPWLAMRLGLASDPPSVGADCG